MKKYILCPNEHTTADFFVAEIDRVAKFYVQDHQEQQDDDPIERAFQRGLRAGQKRSQNTEITIHQSSSNPSSDS